MSGDAAADTCPRCGGGFHCGVNDAAPCACTTLKLTDELRAQLRERYTGCLCLKCLGELARASSPMDVTTGSGKDQSLA
jgi:hypothetical protein